MRVLVVTPSFLPVVGGAELGIYAIYSRLSAKHSIRVLTSRPRLFFSPPSGIEEHLPLGKIEVARFWDLLTLGKTPVRQISGPWAPPVSASFALNVRKQIKDFRPEVINFHYLLPGALAIKAAAEAKVPTLLSLISRTDSLRPENSEYERHREFLLATVRRATKVTALTRYMLGNHVDDFPAEIVPYGTDLRRLDRETSRAWVANELNTPPDANILFSLQRLVPVKEIHILLEMMPEILQEFPETFLLLAGEGPERSRLQLRAEELKIAKQVRFCGHVPEEQLATYFSAADLFVFSSPSETFGVVLAQALASGLPVVACRSSCIPEVVIEGQNGLLVAPHEPAAFAQAVLQLLRSPNTRETMGTEGRARAQTLYHWDSIATRYETLLTEAARAQL